MEAKVVLLTSLQLLASGVISKGHPKDETTLLSNRANLGEETMFGEDDFTVL